MEFEDLSPHLLYKIFENLDFDQIHQLTELNEILDQKIQDDFWQNKYRHDFEMPDVQPSIWKEAYYQASHGKVYSFGHNFHGELGFGQIASSELREMRLGGMGELQLKELGIEDQFKHPTPFLIPNFENIVDVSAGKDFSLILTSNGEVWSFGSNDEGQLGLGNYQDQSRPQLIPNLPPIQAISAGLAHCLLLDRRNYVYVFGWNYYGQLGLGIDDENLNTPVRLSGLPPIQAISAGNEMSLLLTFDGRIYGMGSNYSGQLIATDSYDRDKPTLNPTLKNIQKIACGTEYNLVLNKDGEVYYLGEDEEMFRNENPALISGLPKIIEISTEVDNFMLLAENGDVYTHNNRLHFRLMNSGYRINFIRRSIFKIPEINNIISISSSSNFDLVLNRKRQVYSFGNNEFGQLGRKIPKRSIDFGYFEPVPQLIPGFRNIRKISAGDSHSLILQGPLSLFSTIQTLIQKDWLKSYQPLYQTENENQVLEFIDIHDQVYLAEVYFDEQINKIFPPK